ncbi:MAG TPA: S53 family peptidase [Gemmatimonadales bacterium]|nr:S53 family peptidase [Gemmatimonadales bacterium]
MSDGRGRARIAGSERAPAAGATRVGPVDERELIDVTVRLRPAAAAKARQVYTGGKKKAGPRRPLTRAALAAAVGASAADARRLERYAHQAGLTVVEVSLPRRSVVLRGTAAAMQRAFGVTLETFRAGTGTFRHRTGAVSVPADVAAVITGVFGLDDRPQARPHFRRRDLGPAGAARPAASPSSFTPIQVAQAYAFPAKATGQGQTVGIIELGGGFQATEIDTYLSGLGLGAADVTAVGVDGGSNAPVGNPDSADGEVVLDIEIVAAVAPRSTIAVYFAPNTDRGFLDAVTTAVHDTLRNPDVISISWGGPESTWTAQARTAFDEALQEASAAGIPVCVAAGDNGASDGVSDGQAHVDFPASSPSALACGGTRLVVAGAKVTETVWNDLASGGGATGGGFSASFPAPAWQQAALKPTGQTSRGVPDVSGNADPQTGYEILVDGARSAIGGTSAVAPLWAGLIALCNQATGKRPSPLAPKLYAAEATGFRDITQGDNGGFSAGAGWDACTGLGVPVGSGLLSGVWGAGGGSTGGGSTGGGKRKKKK